jgi:hypothetical protein
MPHDETSAMHDDGEHGVVDRTCCLRVKASVRQPPSQMCACSGRRQVGRGQTRAAFERQWWVRPAWGDGASGGQRLWWGG